MNVSVALGLISLALALTSLGCVIAAIHFLHEIDKREAD